MLAIIKGAVIISPSGNSLVCDGDQLELTCTVTGPGSSLLEWTFAPITLCRAIDANSPLDQIIMINSTLFTFSRILPRNEPSLVSRLLMSPVTTGLNGTVVNCTDVLMMKMASANIHVLNKLNDGMFAR